MRIAIDIQPLQASSLFDGEVGWYVTSLVDALLKHDRQNDYVLLWNALLPPPDLSRFPGCPSFGVAFDENDRLMSQVALAKALREYQVDILHLTSHPYESSRAFSIPQASGVHIESKVICTLYDVIPYLFENDYLRNPHTRRRYRERLSALEQADRVCSVSASAARDARWYLGIDAEKLITVRPAVDLDTFAPACEGSRRERLRRDYGIDKPYLYVTGGNDPMKDIAGLLRAFSRLPADLKASHQLVIGGISALDRRSDYASLARALGVADQVVFIEAAPDQARADLYAHCALFVLPTRYEGVARPLAEALACGAPTLVSQTSPLVEMVGRGGYTVDFGYDDELSSAIAQIVSDDAVRQRLSANSLERRCAFDAAACAETMVAAYRQTFAAEGHTLSQGESPYVLALLTALDQHSHLFLRPLTTESKPREIVRQISRFLLGPLFQRQILFNQATFESLLMLKEQVASMAQLQREVEALRGEVARLSAEQSTLGPTRRRVSQGIEP